MERLIREGKKGKWSSDLVLDLYSGLLLEIWEIVSALIGEAILELLFNLSIRKLGEKYPFLGSLRIVEEGLSFDEMREECRTISPVDLHRGFQGLITHLFEHFSNLAEGVISRELFPKVFPKVKEAERIISQK
jgi:hypothetical protein